MSKFKVGEYVEINGKEVELKYQGTHGKIKFISERPNGNTEYQVEINGVISFFDECNLNKLHNIVQVRHLSDMSTRRYTYNVPANVQLIKGDTVKVKNNNGKETISVCVTNSEMVSNNTIDMIMSGNKVISEVIGIYKLEMFEE